MSEVKIRIDGQEIIADSSNSILEVARSLGKEIPTLCHDPRLAPFSSCFVCLVEVEGARGYVPSCATKVTGGMAVRTDTPEVRSARKAALELLVSNHFADCLGPCELTCPAGVDIQGYIAHLAMGKYREAVALIKETNPLPSVCGRVCTRPCESKCRRNLTDEPVGVDYLKRYAADLDRDCGHPFTPSVKPPSGHRVAVVGAGPAGLTAAYYLALEGHAVTVFEMREKAGGWLMYGIPEYRLPEDVLDYEVGSILKLGVEVLYNQALGRDFSIDDLLARGFDAVFLALGAQKSALMKIPGEDAGGVLAGIDFLERANKGEIESVSGRVAVVGGGNTAVDAARTSLRLGAGEVVVVYRRSRAEMPAHHLEIEEMEKEGVKLELLANPIRYNVDGSGKATGVTCVRMTLGEPDASGRRRPVPVTGSEFFLQADMVIGAIGQQVATDFLDDSRLKAEVKMSKWGTVEVGTDTQATSVPRVYAGGDMVTGAATAIEAIAAGKRAASVIHRRLTGEEILRIRKPFVSRRDNLKPVLTSDDIWVKNPDHRHRVPMLSVEDRMAGFIEVELGYSSEQAAREVARCLECGCSSFFECDLQKICTDYDVAQTLFTGGFHHEHPVEDHPFLRFDMNKCILCGRCVRICEEVVGASALGFVNRGFDTHVRPSMEKPLKDTGCISCGQCADTCPTGAITARPDTPKPGPFKTDAAASVCPFCSVGCGMSLESVGGRVVRASSLPHAPTSGGNLCANGRFGFRVLNAGDRLVRPLVRSDGRLKEASWEEAYAAVKDRFLAAVEAHGHESFAVLAGVRLSNEEAYLAQKLARCALKTPHILNPDMSLKTAPDQFFASMPGTGFHKLAEADFLLVLGMNSLRDYPVLDFRLQRAARSGLTKVFYFHTQPGFLGNSAAKWVKLDPNNVTPFVKALLAETMDRFSPTGYIEGLDDLRHHLEGFDPTEQFRKIDVGMDTVNAVIDQLVASHSMIVFDLETVGAEAAAYAHDLYVLLENRGRRVGILPMVGRANSRGVLEMGCHPQYLPGWRRAGDPVIANQLAQLWRSPFPNKAGMDLQAFLNSLHGGQVKGLFSLGDDLVGCGPDPAKTADTLKQLKCLVVVDMFMTPTAELAHVVLPASASAESDGTYINSERRLQRFHAAVSPPSGKTSVEILGEIARSCGVGILPQGVEALWKEMEDAMPLLKKGGLSHLSSMGAILGDGPTPHRVMVPGARHAFAGVRYKHHGDSMSRRWRHMMKNFGLES